MSANNRHNRKIFCLHLSASAAASMDVASIYLRSTQFIDRKKSKWLYRTVTENAPFYWLLKQVVKSRPLLVSVNQMVPSNSSKTRHRFITHLDNRLRNCQSVIHPANIRTIIDATMSHLAMTPSHTRPPDPKFDSAIKALCPTRRCQLNDQLMAVSASESHIFRLRTFSANLHLISSEGFSAPSILTTVSDGFVFVPRTIHSN